MRLAPSELLSRVAARHGTGRGELADVDDRHGNALSAPFPDGSSTNVDGDSALVLTPGEPLATDIRVPGLPCPQPGGNDTTRGLIAPDSGSIAVRNTLSCVGARS